MTKYGQTSVPTVFLVSVLLAGGFFLTGCSATSSLSCSVPAGMRSGEDGNSAERSLSLRALSPAAKKGHITDSSTTAWFTFEPDELSTEVSHDPLRIAVEVIVRTSVPADVMLAPVFTDDLTKHGRIVQTPTARANALVTGVSGTVIIRMQMIPPDNPVKFAGFAVEALRSRHSDKTGTEVGDNTSEIGDNMSYAEITSVSLVRNETGWEIGSASYRAGFGREGGTRAYREKGPVLLDRGEKAIFTFSASGDDIGTPTRPRRSSFTAGLAKFGWRASPVAHTATVYGKQLDDLPTMITPETGTEHLTGIRITPASDLQSDIDTPIPLDPHAIITWPQRAWRNPEREIFSWDRFPSILIFDTVDYAVQSRYFKRLAFFVEKSGYVGRLVNDADIAHLHGFNAHDYRAESLADFFDRAERNEFALNRHELELRDILVSNGIIIAGDDGYYPGTGAVLSFSRESVTYLRYLFMAHEGFHGLYFTDESFRNEMHRFYTDMDTRAVDFLETYFSIVTSLGYDRTDQFLMKNECMAYTLQQPLNRVSDYFSGTIRERFTRYGGSDTLADYIEQNAAEDFVILGRNLETYVFSRWGLSGGRVGLWYSNRD